MMLIERKRIRVRIEEYKMSKTHVEEALHTVKLDLPLEALREIMEVAQNWDGKLKRRMLDHLLENLEQLPESSKEEIHRAF